MSEVLTTLREEIIAAATRAGLDPRASEDVARNVEERLRTTCGGDEHYIPAPDRESLRERVLTDFTGQNHAEVCRRHGISRATLYRYLLRGE